MGVIAWIVTGLASGLIADMLIPGRRPRGPVITCLIGDGRLSGCHRDNLHGFFNLSTRLTAIAGSAVLLVAYHLASGRTGHRMAHR